MQVVPAFVDETGVLTGTNKEQPVYGIGLLVVHDPAPLTNSFYKLHFSFRSSRTEQRNKLRRQIRGENRTPTLTELDRLMWSTRHHEYKFTGVTQQNIQQYIDLLNVYFSFDSVEFHALLVDKTAPEFYLEHWDNDEWRAYIELARELLNRRPKQPVFEVLDLQGQPNEASIRIDDRVCSLQQVAGCLRATSDMSIFLQIVDVLIGCIQFDLKDHHGYYAGSSKSAAAKRDLAQFVRTKIGLPGCKPIFV